MTPFLRRWFSLFVPIIATIGLVTGCQAPARPNVLIITIDTLRADRLGCYGFELARTPVIDQLARDGVLASNAIASAPITMPSHASIFTGLFPPAHGVRDNGAYALGQDAVTLAERMSADGYTTHAFVSALVLNRRYNLDQGFETYDDDLWAEDDPKLFMIRERQAPKTADRFLAWFDSWKAVKDKPFFTWVHFFDPHQPYRPDPADVALAPSAYDAEISLVDRNIGRIVDSLRDAGVLDETLIIVTSDHGESLGEHGEKTHAVFVYDATVHVPLIVRAPWLFKPKVYDGPVRLVDIMPTTLEVSGLDPGGGMDGESLVDAFRGKTTAPELPQYSESLLSEVGFGMAPLFAIRHEGFKYIRAPRPELYDLRADPKELDNIIDSERRKGQELDIELTRLIDGSLTNAVEAAANPMTKEVEESLQALGYLAPRSDRNAMQGIDPKDGLPIYSKVEDARHLAQQQRWSEAEALLLEVVAQTPRNVSALNVLGLINLKSGDADEAVKYYRQSLDVEPRQFRVYGVLGTIAVLSGDLDHAENEFKAALSINPDFAEAMANLGFLEALRGDQQAAEEWYRKGIAADVTFPRVHRRLGDLFYEAGDFASAYESYQRVIEILPSDLRAVIQAGNCARRLGRIDEAEALFRRAEALSPDSWVATYNRACLLATNGDPDGALEVLLDLADQHRLSIRLVERDSDLAEVRGLPGYPSLRDKLAGDSDVEEQLRAQGD